MGITRKTVRLTPLTASIHLWQAGKLQPNVLDYQTATAVPIKSTKGWVVTEITATLPDGQVQTFVALAVRPGHTLDLPAKIGLVTPTAPPAVKREP